MSWQLTSLHFKQTFADGYRYLDKCGEFLLAAKKKDFLPGESKPTGGKITLPEHRIDGVLSSTELSLRQDDPGENFDIFKEKTGIVAALASEQFGPLDVQSNGIAGKWFFPAKSTEHASEISLQFKPKLQDAISDKLGMSPAIARIDLNFDSGKTTLHVSAEPVTVERAPSKKYVLPFRATREQKNTIDRLNSSYSDGYTAAGLMLNIDLIEYDPPADALEKHFALFGSHAKDLLNLLLPKA